TVNKAIDRAVLDGSFIVNYTGHGGETGWSANRVLDIPSILAWDNINRLAIFMTATCEFGRFDDPVRTSGGELVLLNPNGGGVALLTTTRLVFAFQNYNLNVSFYNRLLDRNPEGEYRRLGEIARRVKNDNSGSLNTRNFSLLGDPALKLAIPDYNVITESVNSKLTISVDSANYKVDTVNALSEVVVKGFVTDFWGEKLENFNGLVYPTVFDKKKTLKTLGNGGATPFTYQTFDARIFKGKATVRNGEFEFKFVVPKDISYDLGKGRITYYSDNNYQTANGEFMDFVIGGSNDSSNADNNGPEIDLYLNDRSFVYGGITNDKPVLLADLSDELGLNTVGSGIGHDIIAIIDENTENTFVLNDYYEANVDDYKSGEIRFPMEQLSEGKHTLTLKAWDVANNSSEKSIEFSVVNEKDIEIDNLVNYPNPFTTNTEFIFQHNQPGIPLDVKLEIFTVSGKLVKSFDQIIVNEGFLSRDIRWNGRDEYGDRIGKGVYLYKLKVRSGNGSTAEKIEKLVIL
ncbi:MAG: type IX secretion system sortase PorU, partial [Vicingaceae bacterium]